ncbi:MAG TPA: outer membrane beta-barrel protein [Chitinophagaceae bacterium]|nr:outer membrane beta-barrel protein [Chitinophagaceae bacterium]
MKKTGLLIAVLLLAAASANAQQGEVRMTASIAGAMPVGQMKDLTDNTTLRGIDVAILYGVNDKLSAGATIGFQDFYKKFSRAIYKLEDGSDISAVLTNSLQTIPVLATVRYSIKPGAAIQPYVSAGIGGAIVLYNQYIGEYPNQVNKIAFAARPGAGVYIPFGSGSETGANIGIYYQYMPYKHIPGITNLANLGFTVGIGFPMRN